MKKRQFLQNAAVLTGTSLLLKVIGIFFRIWMSGHLGAEGMGLHQLIFSVYVLGSTLATTGLSTAVTRLVTEAAATGNQRAIPRVMRRSLILTLALSLASSAVFYLAAPWIGRWWIADVRAIPALRVLTIGFPFMGISACLKGYFYARRRAELPSIAQIFEQVTRIFITMWLFFQTAEPTITTLSAAVMLGDVISEGLSAGLAGVLYAFERDRVSPDTPHSTNDRDFRTGRLVRIAAPITAGRYLNTILRTIENIQVPRSLALFSGSQELGLAAFGNLKGMAMPLIFFPSSFLSAFSTLLIPEMSEAMALSQHLRVRHTADITIRITMAASWLCAGCFWVFAYPLGQLLYNSDEVGFYLQVLAPLVPLMYLESVVDGILKGLNQQTRSLKYSLLDSGLRIALILLLVPKLGIRGFLYIMVVSNLLTCLLNTGRLCRVASVPMDFGKWILRPLSALLIAGSLAHLLVAQTPIRTMSNFWIVALGCTILALVYLFLLFATKTFTQRDYSILKKKS
ncbi:MAG: polysaccharide biosynthesis protein [Clostridia bacterium]|nr:polysaccharide biosynthesis protein [Clostridia bacterium]